MSTHAPVSLDLRGCSMDYFTPTVVVILIYRIDTEDGPFEGRTWATGKTEKVALEDWIARNPVIAPRLLRHEVATKPAPRTPKPAKLLKNPPIPMPPGGRIPPQEVIAAVA